jgi:hypothetical protein
MGIVIRVMLTGATGAPGALVKEIKKKNCIENNIFYTFLEVDYKNFKKT